ncbi:Type IV secretory pathway, VirD4 component, TraG/TraD family ATPase [Marinomonas polaris DSM 16579]|uniref:Type IV secretory pathway, VirD4 component, TraG/TraD family ATPase n=1 Tax=Marinomonas polaris DSM 16579 TaxID=1122206 RepID=A0A1M5EYR1_9GAMM|nr:type IV secretion system DNA-binding domain-containing protein [Marinomonas polaris]SHF84384.1 Type IV secretory pathway, VirD4 component, TraG/TraD family ATPase [Marinomonas polaris DSM 16579]
MINNKPPSVQKNSIIRVLVLGLITFIISIIILIYFTWDVLSPENWGRLDSHLEHWKLIVYDFFADAKTNSVSYYWQQISNRELELCFFIHVLLVILPALLFSILVSIYVRSCENDQLYHVSGARLLKGEKAFKHAKKQLAIELKRGTKKGLVLHPKVVLTRDRENGNFLIIGNQGSGKTVFITPIIKQIIDRGEKAFIYDEKREFTKLFYNSSNTVLISPWDKRGTPWNISADAKTDTDAKLIADHLISETKDPIWSEGARSILSGMIMTLNHTNEYWGWKELANILSTNDAILKEMFTKYYPRATRFIEPNSKTTASFFAQLISSLGWIYILADAWPNAYKTGFSISEWTFDRESKKKVVIVQASAKYKDIGAPIANTLISLMTSSILSSKNSTKRELWMFLDEIGNLPRNESIKKWMTLGRSKGCRIVAGTQGHSQLIELYTEQGANTLLNLFSTIVTMKMGASGGSAEYAAKAFSDRIIERPNLTNQKFIQWQKEIQPLVNASDLVNLPFASKNGIHGYIMVSGWLSVYYLIWPIHNIKPIAAETIAANWTLSQTRKTKIAIKTPMRGRLARRVNHDDD